MVHELELAAVLSAVRIARWQVAVLLSRLGATAEAVDAATVVVSELVTNAVRATGFAQQRMYLWHLSSYRHVIRLRLRLIERSLYIEVHDSSLEPPVLHEPSPSVHHGRGLVLVDRLSRQWGYEYLPTGGKVVWAEVGVS